MKPIAALWRFSLAAAVAIVLMVFISNVITQPIATDTHTYNADFTDVSGLHEGADVRVRGVRVGKVESIALKRSDGRSFASVRFTLDERFGVVTASRLAVKYQALTGLRYIDIVGAAEGAAIAEVIHDVPTTMTQPSFDVTTLFNGLQPVLATLSPDEINTFTDNVSTILAGDGNGLGPMLESIRRLTEFVSDRQQVVATLMSNLTTLANGVSGRSESLIQIMDIVNQPISAAMTVLDEFRKSQIYGPGFTSAAIRLLASNGVKPGIDIDTALDKAFTNVNDAIDAFKRVPVVWENIQSPADVGTPVPCSRGRAELPMPMDVLVNGQRVVLCNR